MWLMALDVGILSCAGGDSWGSRRGKSDVLYVTTSIRILSRPFGTPLDSTDEFTAALSILPSLKSRDVFR